MLATTTLPPAVHWLLVASLIVWFLFELRQGAARRPEAVKADRGSRMVIRVTYVAGGILAWSEHIDPTVQKY